MNVHGLSHIGNTRRTNEDRFLIKTHPSGWTLLAVADGMGGEAAGEQAADTVIACLNELTPEDPEAQMASLLKRAGEMLLQEAKRNPELEGMGSTATAVLLGGNRAYWAHAGDSRLYLSRGGELKQLTRDHTFLQTLIEDGVITANEAKTHPLRNMLDMCVGCPGLEPDTGHIDLEQDDVLLLCTDGLHGELPLEDMAAVLRNSASAGHMAQELLRLGLETGGKDNVTAVVAAPSRQRRPASK
jgi:protein phosphatase